MLQRTARVLGVSVPLIAVVLLPVEANAAATVPLVSLNQARTALPAASSMPGHPPTVITSTATEFGAANPCPSPHAKPVVLKQSHEVTNIYITAAAPHKPTPLQFSITAIVFHTSAAAKSGMATIVGLEKHCPKVQGDAEAQLTRTLSAPYAANGWAGWRSEAKFTFAPEPSGSVDFADSEHMSTEYLARGNVVLLFNETGPATAGSAPKHEAARKLVTKLMLAGFAKL